jgi:hypothetical protein
MGYNKIETLFFFMNLETYLIYFAETIFYMKSTILSIYKSFSCSKAKA